MPNLMLREHRRGALLAVITLLCCSALFAACGGGASTTLDASAAAPQDAASLPSPDQIVRDASLVRSPLTCYGNEFLDSMPRQNVVSDGTAGQFTPVPGAAGARSVGDAAYAIYGFDLSPLGSLSTPLRVQLRATATFSDGNSRVFAGLGDPDRKKWYWVELEPDPEIQNSWSWGETQAGSGHYGSGHGSGRMSPLMPVVVMIFGDTGMQVQSIEIQPVASPPAGGTVAFRKGWDGTIKGVKKFDSSLRVVGDGTGNIFATCYDDSSQQLDFVRLSERIPTFMTVECDSDSGLSNDLVLAPGGSLILPYTQTLHMMDVDRTSGFYRTMQPFDIASLNWSPRSNFETGDDGTGMLIDAGANVRCMFDSEGIPHMFYEDQTNGRIRHAWLPYGALDWMHEYVSPEGEVAGRPFGISEPGGSSIVCVYMAEGKLYAADRGAMGWTPHLLADDVFNPLDETAQIGFCDGSVRPTDNTIVVAYSAKGGGGGGGCGKVVFQDMHFAAPPSSSTFDATDGTGAYISLCMLGDGSVRLAQYNPKEYKVYFETGDIPSQEFTSLPAVQFGPDEDCDGIDLYVGSYPDGNGFHDACLVTLSSRAGLGDSSRKKEFKGHVSLLK